MWCVHTWSSDGSFEHATSDDPSELIVWTLDDWLARDPFAACDFLAGRFTELEHRRLQEATA